MTDSNCMWKAPQRLGTSYPGNGFENAYSGPTGPASPVAILKSWKEGGNGPHNDVILNRQVWSNVHWRATSGLDQAIERSNRAKLIEVRAEPTELDQ